TSSSHPSTWRSRHRDTRALQRSEAARLSVVQPGAVDHSRRIVRLRCRFALPQTATPLLKVRMRGRLTNGPPNLLPKLAAEIVAKRSVKPRPDSKRRIIRGETGGPQLLLPQSGQSGPEQLGSKALDSIHSRRTQGRFWARPCRAKRQPV